MSGNSSGGLEVLREVYLEGLEGKKATATSVGRSLRMKQSLVRSVLKEAKKDGLVNTVDGLVRLSDSGRRRLKVVMLGGAFEVIHPGHIHAFDEARGMGNTLVVVVATDESVERNKGRSPVTRQDSRVKLVSSVRQVDRAIPGNRGSIFDILTKVRPDVVALGYDQRHSGKEIAREAMRRGVKVRVERLGSPIPGVKTSKILVSL